MWEPVGPLPATVYWRRRCAVLATVLTLVGLVFTTAGAPASTPVPAANRSAVPDDEPAPPPVAAGDGGSGSVTSAAPGTGAAPSDRAPSDRAPSDRAPSDPAPSDPAPSGPAAPSPDPAVRHSRTGGLWVGLILSALVLLVLLVFILQNGAPVQISFFSLEGVLPTGVALLLAAIAGILLVAIPGSVRILQLRRAARRGPRSGG